MAVIDPEFGLQVLDVVRQLTTVLGSEIAAVENENAGHVPKQLRKLLETAGVVRQFEIGELRTDLQVRAHRIIHQAGHLLDVFPKCSRCDCFGLNLLTIFTREKPSVFPLNISLPDQIIIDCCLR